MQTLTFIKNRPSRLLRITGGFTRSPLALVLAVALACQVPASAFGQAVSSAPAASPVKVAPLPSEETLQLTPFQVVADERGYQAFNTLSGTRLNSKLEDLGSSITVVTKQQLIDTAAIDINDVFLYEANTEGTGNFTQFNTNRNGGVQDNVSADPQTANRIRGIGGSGASGTGTNTNSTFGANTAIGNFASNAKVPLDLYNIDSVEINRGPNSSLFGIGNSAGSVNLVPTQANPTRAVSGFTFRLDSFGGRRESLDLNRPLIANRLAVRIAAVDDSKGFTRKPSSERIRRGQISFLARPFATTTLTGSAERYTNFARRPNSLTPR